MCFHLVIVLLEYIQEIFAFDILFLKSKFKGLCCDFFSCHYHSGMDRTYFIHKRIKITVEGSESSSRTFYPIGFGILF